MEKKKFYQKTWFLCVVGFLFPIVGILLVWILPKDKSKGYKIGLTVIFLIWLLVLHVMQGGNKGTDSQKEPITEKTEAAVTQLSESEETTVEQDVVTEEESIQVEEATEVSGIDAEEWPELAQLGLSNDTMLNIYKEYEKAWESYPENPDEQEKFEKQVAKSIADKYDINPDQADMVYFYVMANYEKVVGASSKEDGYTLKYGEFLEANGSGSTIVIKAKIESSLTKEMTIKQNYYNVCDLIRNQGLEVYDEVQYWAVADMVDGSVSKVISFTVPKDIINKIANEEFPDNLLGDYVDDLWILPSLRN